MRYDARAPMRVCAALVALVTLIPAASWAGTIVYTDRETFLAAGTILTTFDEPVPCVPRMPGFLTTCDKDYGTVSVRFDEAAVSSGVVFFGLLPVSGTFAQPTSMYGFDLHVFPSQNPGFIPGTIPLVRFVIPGGETLWFYEPGDYFVGFGSTDGTPFTGFVLPQGGSGTIDNLIVAVPERQSTAFYLLLGLLSIAGWQRFGRRADGLR